jgi:hypothetical protein
MFGGVAQGIFDDAFGVGRVEFGPFRGDKGRLVAFVGAGRQPTSDSRRHTRIAWRTRCPRAPMLLSEEVE